MIFTLYILIVVCIGFATVVEKYRGTAYVGEHIYGAWWFSALWAVLTVASLAYIMKQRLYKRMAVMLLHLSFVVILAGALVTHLTARRDTIHLRMAEKYRLSTTIQITLKEFRIINYPGTDTPLDYQSKIGLTFHGSRSEVSNDDEVLVSMNNIGNIDGYRLFQSSYDTDGEGVTLGVSYDPYGIAITYLGYLLLLIGIIATLFSRKTHMRLLYHKAMRSMVLLFIIHYSCVPMVASGQSPGALFASAASLPVVEEDIAHRMGTIQVLYNNRICPLNTVATDFLIKMTGSASWKGYSADEVFFSWMIYYSPWEQELLLNNTKKKGAEDRNAVVEMFYNGQFTRIFPYRIGETVCWFSPGGQILPREIPVKEQFFIKQSMDFLTEAIVTGQRERALEIIAKIKLFQRDMIGDVLPSDRKTQAELFYNKLRSIKFPVFLTAQLGLRWWLSGHIPLSNGYETMLFMAWMLLMLTIVLFRKFRVVIVLGPLAALCCMLVAMMTGGSSQLSPLMPVLQSPLLSLHVMTVMCAYSLFALQMLISVYALVLMKRNNSSLILRPFGSKRAKPGRTHHSSLFRITALSQLLLYPAVFLLTVGIFLGAVWANVSWGNYWSWDPKESWALITFMVYAVPFHSASIPLFHHPRFYHLYMIVAFFAVLITYFGVNFLLGGMHSYA